MDHQDQPSKETDSKCNSKTCISHNAKELKPKDCEDVDKCQREAAGCHKCTPFTEKVERTTVPLTCTGKTDGTDTFKIIENPQLREDNWFDEESNQDVSISPDFLSSLSLDVTISEVEEVDENSANTIDTSSTMLQGSVRSTEYLQRLNSGQNYLTCLGCFICLGIAKTLQAILNTVCWLREMLFGLQRNVFQDLSLDELYQEPELCLEGYFKKWAAICLLSLLIALTKMLMLVEYVILMVFSQMPEAILTSVISCLHEEGRNFE